MKQMSARSIPFLLLCSLACGTATAADYAVVVSRKTASDADWKRVVDALASENEADVFTYDQDVADALPALRDQFPRYACFIARPEEATREFVARVHRLTRRLDDDPYTDCFWGILTGYDAENALRVARHQEPLVIHKTAAATEIALEACEQGVWYSEVRKNRAMKKEPGNAPAELNGPDDTTEALAGLLGNYHADLFVTSGHASEHDWSIGYGYRNGSFRCADGVLYGLDTRGRRHPVHSDNPKVYLPVGNCLMGHVDGRDCMALAFMNSAGVRQMAGYTVETWYGYSGWGMLDYFVEQPGRYTCAEAFAAGDDALIQRLQACFPDLLKVEDGFAYRGPVTVSDAARAAGLTEQDGRGLLYDRDALAFYGDPAWEARMAEMPKAWDQVLSEKDGLYTLEVRPNRGSASFDPVSSNGSQRGYRPIIQFLPHRVEGVRVVEGADLAPTITDDCVIVPNPRHCEPGKSYRVTFRATSLARPAAPATLRVKGG